MGILCTKRGPSNLTFEHNRSKTPPVAVVRITMTAEDLGRNIVRSADSRVCHHSSGLSPIIDDTAVADSEINLVETDGIPVCWST